MCETIIGGIIGIVGTILGFLLNLFSQRGSLQIYPQKWVATVKFKNKYVTDEEGNRDIQKTDIPDIYQYNIQIQFYNSSSNGKLVRDIKFIFINGNERIFDVIPYENQLTENRKIVSAYTVQAKNTLVLNLTGTLRDKQANQMKDVTSVEISYKGKKKTETKTISSYEKPTNENTEIYHSLNDNYNF